MFSAFSPFRIFCHEQSLQNSSGPLTKMTSFLIQRSGGGSRSLTIRGPRTIQGAEIKRAETAVRNALGTTESRMVLEIQSWLAVTQYTTAVFQPQAVLPPLLEGETSYQLA